MRNRRELTAQDFGFVLAGCIALLWRHAQRIEWQDPWITQNFDELTTAAVVFANNPLLQEQIVADVQIAEELTRLAAHLEGPDPDFGEASFFTRRLWRAVKPFAM